MSTRKIDVSAEAFLVTEHCPFCDTEVHVVWDTTEDGHSLCCPCCGKRIMLCSECPASFGESSCDFNSCANREKEAICFWDNRFEKKEEETVLHGKKLPLSDEEIRRCIVEDGMPVFSMKCGRCGGMCFDDDKYCSECGTKFDEE